MKAVIANEQSDDDDEGALARSRNNVHLKNEIADVPINIPDTEEVGHEEAIEKVGDIMSIVGNVVIVKGLPSGIVNRGLDKALDSDTLLVFDDRRVLGYVRIVYCGDRERIHIHSGRFTRLLDQHHSHCIKSGSAMRFP